MTVLHSIQKGPGIVRIVGGIRMNSEVIRVLYSWYKDFIEKETFSEPFWLSVDIYFIIF